MDQISPLLSVVSFPFPACVKMMASNPFTGSFVEDVGVLPCSKRAASSVSRIEVIAIGRDERIGRRIHEGAADAFIPASVILHGMRQSDCAACSHGGIISPDGCIVSEKFKLQSQFSIRRIAIIRGQRRVVAVNVRQALNSVMAGGECRIGSIKLSQAKRRFFWFRSRLAFNAACREPYFAQSRRAGMMHLVAKGFWIERSILNV